MSKVSRVRLRESRHFEYLAEREALIEAARSEGPVALPYGWSRPPAREWVPSSYRLQATRFVPSPALRVAPDQLDEVLRERVAALSGGDPGGAAWIPPAADPGRWLRRERLAGRDVGRAAALPTGTGGVAAGLPVAMLHVSTQGRSPSTTYVTVGVDALDPDAPTFAKLDAAERAAVAATAAKGVPVGVLRVAGRYALAPLDLPERLRASTYGPANLVTVIAGTDRSLDWRRLDDRLVSIVGADAVVRFGA